MSIESSFENDMKRLGEQLANDEITVREYNKEVGDLELDMIDFAKSGIEKCQLFTS